MALIESIRPSTVVFVTLSDESTEFWKEWRTNSDGTYWECAMGMSWEEIDPPQEVIDEYRRLRGTF